MKVVVVKSPPFIGLVLRKIFKIKKIYYKYLIVENFQVVIIIFMLTRI